MADRVLSIEIGSSITKVCEIERNSKSPKILNSFVVSTPDGFVNDGIIELKDEFIARFKTMMDVNKIRTKKAIFTIASNRIVSKEATIPFVKETKIKDVVRANLSEYFPVDPAQYMFSHSVIGVVRDGAASAATPTVASAESKNGNDASTTENGATESKKKPVKAPKVTEAKATGYKIQVLAAPRQLINGYEKLAKVLGLELAAIDYNGNSIYQAAKEECKDGVQLIVKVDERTSILMVLDNGVISLNRTIPYGIDEAINALQRTTELGDVSSYEAALELARRKRVVLSNFKGELMATDSEEESEAEAIRADKLTVTEAFKSLGSGIFRVIDYYNSNHSGRHVEKVMITGIGADFSGLSHLLNNELDVKVRNLTKLSNIDVQKVFHDATFGEYVSVIGAALAPVEFYRDHDDNDKGKGGKSKSGSSGNSTLIAAIVFLLGIIASAAMVIITTLPYLDAKAKNERYKKTIADLQPSYDIYLNYLTTEKNLDYLEAVDKSGRNRNEQLVEFLDYLETHMPYTFCVNSIETDTEKVTMDVTVSSKEEVAYTVEKLKECDIFSYTSLSEVSLLESELGEILYGFTVELSYAPIDFDDENEEEAE